MPPRYVPSLRELIKDPAVVEELDLLSAFLQGALSGFAPGVTEEDDSDIQTRPEDDGTIPGLQLDTVPQAEAEAGVATTRRIWTAQRVKQALDVLTPGIATFLSAPDTPSSYSGQAAKVVSVNGGETALEFTTPAAGSNGWTTVIKSANEEVISDTTLQDDDALKFTMLAGATYSFQMLVIFQQTNGGFKFRHAGPASPTLVVVSRYCVLGNSSGFVAINTDPAYSAADVNPGAASGVISAVWLSGFIQNGANAGDFVFRWAQAASNASPTTVYAGSYVAYKKL